MRSDPQIQHVAEGLIQSHLFVAKHLDCFELIDIRIRVDSSRAKMCTKMESTHVTYCLVTSWIVGNYHLPCFTDMQLWQPEAI